MIGNLSGTVIKIFFNPLHHSKSQRAIQKKTLLKNLNSQTMKSF